MGKFSELIREMTIQEKLAQMTQIMGDCFVSQGYGKLMGLSYGFGIPEELAWNIGSVLGMGGAEKLRRVQDLYLSHNRHKIPLMFMCDIIHGYRTIFPSPLAMACTWQPELVEKSARIAAKEASVSGVTVTFSPMADLSRDARWGRSIEGTGEDPFLNSLYAAAFVRGYQGGGVGNPYQIASCVKHFAAYGAAEGGRDYNTTSIGDYDLFENYLPAYQAAVKAGCRLVMSAFNALNGVPCTGNRWLFQDILRKEWGFDGTVITDCTALYELIPHGYSETVEDAAASALEAGMEIEMVSTAFFQKGEELVRSGRISERCLDEAVEHILELKDELGLFENPYKDLDEEKEKQLHLCAEHRAAARDMAAESAVLLKNSGNVLPLSRQQKIALIGPYADSQELLDIWKCEGREEECVSLFQGLKDKADCILCPACGLREGAADLAAARKAASQCDVTVLALGEPPEMSAEAGSRAYLTLPQEQLRLAEAVLETGKPTVVVLFHGRPLELGSLAQKADAILAAWYPGTEGGSALAELLMGERSPSGRLTMCFPHTVGQLPLYYNALPTGRPKQGEQDEERFRSRYLDAPNLPLYPFGHGLTYTSFSYSPVTLSAQVMHPADVLTASVRLRNTGDRAGVETVQLYLRDMGGSRSRPVRMLKDFQRVALAPGEEKTVQFRLGIEQLKYHTPANGFTWEAGAFQVFIGPDACTENGASFRLEPDPQ